MRPKLPLCSIFPDFHNFTNIQSGSFFNSFQKPTTALAPEAAPAVAASKETLATAATTASAVTALVDPVAPNLLEVPVENVDAALVAPANLAVPVARDVAVHPETLDLAPVGTAASVPARLVAAGIPATAVNPAASVAIAALVLLPVNLVDVKHLPRKSENANSLYLH